MTRPRAILAGLVILLLALLVRAPGLAAGRPYIHYVDEGSFLHPVAHMLREGDWDQRSYLYPALPGLAVAAAARLYAPFHPLRHGGASFRAALSAAPHPYYDILEPFELLVLARCLSLLAGLGLVVLTGLYARRLAGPSAGLFAAFLAAFVPALAIRGDNATVDPYAALFALACFHFADRARTSSRPGIEAALAGLMAGFAFTSKYPAVTAAAGAGLILLLGERSGREKIRLLALGAAAASAGVVAAMPSLVFRPQEVWSAIERQGELYARLSSAPLWKQALVRAEWDLSYEHPELGAVYLLLTLAGVLLGLRDRRWARTVAGWLLVCAISLALYLPQGFQPFRNLLPLVPLSCVAVSFVFTAVRERLARPRWVDAAAALLVLACFGLPLAGYARERARLVDSRVQAVDWLAARVRPEDTVLVVSELAFLPSELDRLKCQVLVRRWEPATSFVARRRPRFVVAGRLRRKGGVTVNAARHELLGRFYDLRAHFGEDATIARAGLWHGNRQVVYVLQKR
ncbi:MAG TPA: glycosyltransferase family 39 protein [Thermoanaerobaculia bacterium]|nr:glycosyltransferase family 39 protein [Thermoanaerobaculia bacterium]